MLEYVALAMQVYLSTFVKALAIRILLSDLEDILEQHANLLAT